MISPHLKIPLSLLKFTLVPEICDEVDLRLAIGRYQYGHDIEAIWHFKNTEDTAIDPGRARYLPLFSEVDGGDHRRKFSRPARLYFDEAQRLSIKCDDVDLTGYLHAL